MPAQSQAEKANEARAAARGQVLQKATANLHIQPSSFIGLNNLKLALPSTPSFSQVNSESAEQTQLPPPTSAKCQDPLTRKACYLLQSPLLNFS